MWVWIIFYLPYPQAATQTIQKTSTCFVGGDFRFGHNKDSKRLIYSDYPFSKKSQWKMSTDDVRRVDQYFVKCYTEVYIKIQNRSNLNRTISDLRPTACGFRQTLHKKILPGTRVLRGLQWFIWVSPQKGSLSIFIFTSCPSRHARRLSASLATTVSRTNTSATKLM